MKIRSLIVNALTFARFPLIFLWAFIAVIQEYNSSVPLAALALTLVAMTGVSDLLDGMLARRWNVVSPLGKMADPLMDKIFYIVVFPTITWQALHSAPEVEAHALVLLALTILYMLRDTWVTFMRSVGTMYGADVAAMWLGKVRTALSFPGAGWVYMYFALSRYAPDSWQGVWLGSCYFVEAFLALLTVWSFVTYTASYMPYLKKALERK